ncbi:LiaF domain-containing protein [Pseudoalteromonas sp. YIC-827]|uniref:LiaF domain-containing protein n=1 Tax=Pseudoalteromonas qingdaonensis TaxID=3131913 RepID=A0ABU9N3F3_9GAMM
MSVPVADRPLEQVKEEVIDQLILNYSHGEISAEAFERRLDAAYDSTEQEYLVTLVADLPLQADPRYQSEKAARLRPQYGRGDEQPIGESITTILSSDHRGGDWVVPKEIQIKNVLGTLELDFSNAIFSNPDVHIHLNCYLGSCEIYVPEGVDVVTQTTNIIASTSNQRVALGPRDQDRQRPRILLTGRNVLGSVEVSVKRTMKEKLKSFADNLRTLFDDGYDSGNGKDKSDKYY